MRGKVLIYFLLFSLFLTSCASTGNQVLKKTPRSDLECMIKQIQTKDDAKRIFGDPSDIDIDTQGKEKWTYTSIKSSSFVRNFIPIVSSFSSGSDDKKKKLILIFDEKGCFEKHLLSAASEQTHYGVIP